MVDLGGSIIGWRELNLWAESGSSYFKGNLMVALGFQRFGIQTRVSHHYIHKLARWMSYTPAKTTYILIILEREKSKWKQAINKSGPLKNNKR